MKAFYCLGTHWDREWYEPFQEYRMWLVELIDELLARMERDPEYAYFHLDGQTIVLEDYAAIRPENRPRLEALIREGRILVGPWYNLPDEFLVSGESLVRNLLKGAAVCREWGAGPMPFAYTPDQFGHIAALPAVMTGFGLEMGIQWRGSQDETTPAHFVWEGPGGERLVMHKLMDRGSYGVFDFEARRPIEAAGFSDESFAKHFEPYIADEARRSPLPYVLLLDAIDHQRAPASMPRLLDELKRRYPGIEFVWSTLPEYMAHILPHAAGLPLRKGELREPRIDNRRVGQYLIVHTLSARYPVKQANDRCAALLERWAEPYAVFHALAGGQPILRYLDTAWNYLLKNHPHDSICGCSIDQVHQDMVYRFDQSRLIADGFVRRAMAAVGGAAVPEGDAIHLRIHNPLPFARTEVVDIEVVVPHAWGELFRDGLFTAEAVKRFRVVDRTGAEAPFQLRRVERGHDTKWLTAEGRWLHDPEPRYDTYRLAVEAALPPCGHAGLALVQTDKPMRNAGTLLTAPMRAENGLIACEVHADGTATLTNLADGRAFGPLFVYEDRGDSGDGWTWGQCIDDRIVRTPGARVITAIDEDGPLRAAFRIEREIEIPAAWDRSTGARSEQRATVRIVDRLIVEKGSPCLRVESHIENTARDHRLRVLFDTGVRTDRSFADSPYAMVERDVAGPAGSEEWEERVNPEKPFTGLCGAADERGGLAILAPFGLHEYALLDNAPRTLALTLFRAFHQTVMTHGEPGGQLLGPLDFAYALMPFSGPPPIPAMLRRIAAMQTGIRSHRVPEAAPPVSVLRVDADDAVVTAIKPAEDRRGFVLRLWNPGGRPAPASIVCGFPIGESESSRLDETPLGPLAVEDERALRVTVPPGAVTTIRIVPASKE